MQWADICSTAAVALFLAGSVIAAPADPPAYGKVETFEPGKKYNCVPTADRKSWDCTQAGKATKDDTPPPAPRRDEPAPVAAATPPPPPTPPAQAATAGDSHTGKLPSYLLAPGASDHAAPAPATPAPTARPEPAAAPEVHTSTNPQPAAPPARPVPTPPPAPVPEAAPKPAPEPRKPVAPQPAPAAAPTPAPASPPAPPAHSNAPGHGGDFLDLSGDQYVIELARGDSQASIAAAHAALNLPHGQAYELHLRQNGGDAWLLVWGSFDDVDAARAARGELPAAAHAGWPRRVAPLQAEVRRAQE